MGSDRFTRWTTPIFAVGSIGVGISELTGERDGRVLGVGMIAFGLSLISAYPLMVGKSGVGRAETGRVSGTGEPALVFPYSTSRTWAATAGSFFFTISCLTFATSADAFVRWVGVIGAAFFGFVFLSTLRGVGGGRLALTPTGIVNGHGFMRSFVPWTAVEDVRLTNFGSEAFIVVDVTDRGLVETSPGERMLMAINRRLTGDVNYPARYLAVHPDLIVQAIRHYWRAPEDRAELGAETSLERVRVLEAD